MNYWELLTSSAVQDFIQNAFKRKMDPLQVSTALNKAGYSNEDRIAIMDYMALVPKIREKFFGKETSGKVAGKNSDVFLLCDRLALEQSTAQDIGKYKANLWNAGLRALENRGDLLCENRSELHGKNSGESRAPVVHDLCCGMGGDSFFIPAPFKVIGVDLDENRLAMYRYNMQTMRGTLENNGKPENNVNSENNGEPETILADVREVAAVNPTDSNGGAANPTSHADFFTIDPARRAVEGENQRDLRNLTPSFAEVLKISNHYKGGMAKLPPGYPTDEIPQNAELVYLGSHADCRELLVLFGDLAQNPGKVRAIMVDKDGRVVQTSGNANQNSEKQDAIWVGYLSEIQAASNKDAEHDLPGCERSFRNATSESDLPVGEIAAYLSEPTALLIRSHLFGSVAQASDSSAHLISEGIAYVASDNPLPPPAFACFRILDQGEITTSAVRDMLKRHNVGKLTLKLRGVKLNPDEEIKRLKPKGKESAILFYTRFKGEKIAILAKRL